MIQLDLSSQERLAARIAARKRGGRRYKFLRDDVLLAAGRGFAPDAIGEHYGRSTKWAEQILKLPR
jgi:hypothetical protein